MATYGLIDNGSGGWEWSATPTYGLSDDGAGGWEWSTDYSYLLDEDWEWVSSPASPLVAPFYPVLSHESSGATVGVGRRAPSLSAASSRRPQISVISV